jgi:hypothetical protein
MQKFPMLTIAVIAFFSPSYGSADVSQNTYWIDGIGWFVEQDVPTPPSKTYEFPIGTNILEVYQNGENGSIIVTSADGTVLREITRSDIAQLGRSLSDLDLDGIQNGEADVTYRGYWRSGACESLTACVDMPTPLSIDRDGSIRLLELPTYGTYTSSTAGSSSGTGIIVSGPIEVTNVISCSSTEVCESASYHYGRDTVFDPLTLTKKSETLIAYSQDSYDYAISKGYDAVLKNPNLRRVGTFAAPEGWVITADEVRGSDGKTILSANTDTVFIANGSLRIQPSTTPSSNGTVISSSDGTLVLGDNSTHRTIVRGTLEVPTPNAPSQAANKLYVDSATSIALAMSSLPTSANGGPYLGFAAGTLGGETAYALGFSYSEVDTGFRFNLNLGHSNSSGTGAAVGVGIQF